MDARKIEKLRARLLAEQEAVEREMDGIRQSLDVALEDSIAELSTYDNHPADIGTETFERSKDFALQENARLRLKEVRDALRKMSEGTYGRCDECGTEIPLERLDALPRTTKCRDCKDRGEAGANRKRPVEERSLAQPFLPAGDESVVYDREDTWQDLSQHGLSTETESLEEEDRGHTEDIDAIPYVKEDGAFFQDTRVRGDTGGHS